MLRADDTEIYGTITSVSLEPNVLIIFDSSGSMDTADVPGEPISFDELSAGQTVLVQGLKLADGRIVGARVQQK